MTKPVSPLLSTAAVLAGLGALIGAAVAGFSALVVLLGVAIAAALVTKLWSYLCLKGVTGERRLSEKRVFPGDEVLLTLRVVNRKLLPLPWVEIQDEVPASLVAGASGARDEPAGGPSRFPFLAPVGDQVSEPQRLFLVYMLDFDFVRRRSTEVHAAIGNRELRPATIPLLRAGRRILLMRYSDRPVIGFFNPPMDSPTLFETAVPGTVAIGGMRMQVDASGRVVQAASGESVQSVQVDFAPGFPNLLGLSETETQKGTWAVRIAGAAITGGTYYVRRTDSTVASRIDVTDKWSPSGLPPGCTLLTKVVPSFRNWPTTYRWESTVQLDEGLALTGGWKRTTRKGNRC